MRTLKASILALLVGAFATGSFASTVYSNNGAFASATSGVSTDSFDSYAWTGAAGNYLGTSVTLGSISYSYNNFGLYGVGAANIYDAAYHTSNYLEWQSLGTNTASFGGLYNAFGVDFGEFYGGVRTFTFAFDNGDTFSMTGLSNSYAFFGVVTDTAFSSVAITANGDYAAIDNISFGNGHGVPETSSTRLLLVAGLSALAVYRRRIAA